MIDGIIKADGTSRLMRANLPATYEEFKARAANGTLLLDVLFNEAGWSQIPTFLNKANLLKDDTASLFNLDANAVPDDVFNAIKVAFDNSVKFQMGSYTGTGTIGESNPNVLTFDFAPKMFVLFTGNATQYVGSGPSSWGYLLVTENNLTASVYGKAYFLIGNEIKLTGATNYFTFSGNAVSWYVPYDPFANVRPEPDCQLNEAGKVYQYIVFGKGGE